MLFMHYLFHKANSIQLCLLMKPFTKSYHEHKLYTHVPGLHYSIFVKLNSWTEGSLSGVAEKVWEFMILNVWSSGRASICLVFFLVALFWIVLFHVHCLKHDYVALHLQWHQVHDGFIYSVLAGQYVLQTCLLHCNMFVPSSLQT